MRRGTPMSTRTDPAVPSTTLFRSLPGRKARPHGQRPGIDRGGMAHRMFRDQLLLVDPGIALILALERPAVGEEMLGGCRDMAGIDALARDRKSTRLNSSH